MSAPRAVIEHYRNPQNKRAIASPSAQGSVEGRKPGEALTVYLKVEGGKIADASFTNTGDRMDDPGGSMLTSMLRGMSVADVERLSVVDVARRLDSPATPGVAIVAHEALRAALFSLKGLPVPPSGKLICP